MDLPVEFKQQMQCILGKDADAFFRAMTSAPEVSVRINPAKIRSGYAGYEAESEVEWCGCGVYLASRPVFTLNPLLHGGGFYVQDASSMIHCELASRLAAELRGGSVRSLDVADLCAAPGGKTTAALTSLLPGDTMLANEFDPRRARILQENIAKWGAPDVAVYNTSPDRLAASGATFDIIILDAPCSGEGMMRKDSEAIRQWSHRLVDGCSALQRQLIDQAVLMLRPGGFLIYSTCTFNRIENEDQVAYMRDIHGLDPYDPGFSSVAAGGSLDPDIPALRFMPHVTRGEGLFVAVVRASGQTPVQISAYNSKRSVKTGKRNDRSAVKGVSDKDLRKAASDWIENGAEQTPMSVGDGYYAVGHRLCHMIGLVGERGLLYAGTPLAVEKGGCLVPHPMLPFSTQLRNDAFPVVELTEDEAIRYLRREPLVLPQTTPRGYVAVSYSGVRLGWVKNIGNRANNLFPPSWKIRI